jgi:hypothetical protein
MKERIAAPVGRIDAGTQVVPVANGVHRLIADDLLQEARRRRPVDAAEHQEAAIEPGREQVEEVIVDHGEIVAMIHGVDELLAHAHQRRRSAGGEVEAAEQLEPSRLGGAMELGGGEVRRRGLPGRDRRAEPRAVGSEAPRQHLEKGDAGTSRELGVARQDFAGERHAGGFAAAGEQVLAQLGEIGRALLGDLAPVARAIDQGAAALRNGLQHVAEKGGIHGVARMSRRVGD